MGYDPDEPRDSHGRWGSGGAAIASRTTQAVDWLKSGGAQQALASIVTVDRVKTAVSLGIKSALYHIGNMDDPAMEVIDPFVHNQVHNVAANLQVASGRARDMMIAVVRAHKAARAGGA